MSDTLLTAVVTLVVGGPVAYIIGLAQNRRNRLEEKRAEVIAELFRLLYLTQDAFFHWSSLSFEGARQREEIADRYAEQGKKAVESLNNLKIYFYSNEVWLDSRTASQIMGFIEGSQNIVNAHPSDLRDIAFHWTDEGRRVSSRMRTDLLVFRQNLFADLRRILYPPPWYDAPLRWLEWFENRNRRTSDPPF